jgi:hypothetical protein
MGNQLRNACTGVSMFQVIEIARLELLSQGLSAEWATIVLGRDGQ